jgi:hypothetical protein
MIDLNTASPAGIVNEVDTWLHTRRDNLTGETLAGWLLGTMWPDWDCSPTELAWETMCLALGIPSDTYDLDPTEFALITEDDDIIWLESMFDERTGAVTINAESVLNEDDRRTPAFVVDASTLTRAFTEDDSAAHVRALAAETTRFLRHLQCWQQQLAAA